MPPTRAPMGFLKVVGHTREILLARDDFGNGNRVANHSPRRESTNDITAEQSPQIYRHLPLFDVQHRTGKYPQSA